VSNERKGLRFLGRAGNAAWRRECRSLESNAVVAAIVLTDGSKFTVAVLPRDIRVLVLRYVVGSEPEAVLPAQTQPASNISRPS